MIVVAILAVGTVLIAAAASLWILQKDYLPLLDELERAKETLEEWEHKGQTPGETLSDLWREETEL